VSAKPARCGVLASALLVMALAGLAACAPAARQPAAASRAQAVSQAVNPTAPQERRSGYHFMSRSTQALQDDDTQNPAFLWVEEGRRRFENQCTACHRAQDLRDVATRYPALDAASGQPISLPNRIRQCHSQRMATAAPAMDSEELLALESYLAHASRGLPLSAPADPRLAPYLAEGQRWWNKRLGQVDLSCADCHDRLAGQRLAGSTIPQAHPTGYPVYRLEWQALGSLQRRLRGCLTGVRAEPFPDGHEAWTLLELYLKQRASGMPVDAPAVRP